MSLQTSLLISNVTFTSIRASDMASSGGKETQVLKDIIASTLSLLQQFATSLSPSSSVTETARIENPPDPLRVLSDSSKLVKAHTTKLSLLAINKPFTPSAVTKVLKELSSTCLPAMMSAVQICEQEKAVWGSMMGREVQLRVQRVFKEMQSLLEELQSIAAGTQQAGRRDTLSSTGVVWESCDAAVELEQLVLGGLALQKVEQYRDTIKDAIEELKEWAEGSDLDNEGQGDVLLDDDDEGVDGDKDSIEDIFNAANSMPKDRPELKALADEADAKLKKVAILYEALIKRRIKTFKREGEGAAGHTERRVSRLDELMLHLKRMPHQVDELASCFYDLDEEKTKAALGKVVDEGKAAAAGMRNDWPGGEDAFTEWTIKWMEAVG